MFCVFLPKDFEIYQNLIPKHFPLNVYYHYTNQTHAAKIKQEKTLKKSTVDGDVCYGQGVYFSSLDPKKHTKEEIAWDNWGSFLGKKRIEQGKMDCVIKVLYLEPVETSVGRLGVVVYGEDVNLTTYLHAIEKSHFKDSNTEKEIPTMTDDEKRESGGFAGGFAHHLLRKVARTWVNSVGSWLDSFW